MLSFIQLNMYLLVVLFALLVVWLIAVASAPKEAFKLVSAIFIVLSLGIIVSMVHNTIYNQVPKREIDRTYVNNGVLKYQQSINQNKDSK